MGVNCYARAMRVAAAGCGIAFGLSVWAGWRREKGSGREREGVDK